MNRFLLLVLVLCSQPIWAWSNHTLVSHELLATMPQVSAAKPVEVTSLERFLVENEQALEDFLQQQELWMRQNLWHYAPRPDALKFVATGNASDIRQRFAHAIRVNPNMKWPLYLQLMPGDERPGLTDIAPQDISVFNDLAYLPTLQLVQLQDGERVAPLDVVVSGNDEPDHGLDIGLFTDSGTEHGQIYGFGAQPFGNPNLEYGTQAPFHMGFYHESGILYALGGFLKQTYPEYRILLFKQLSEFAFAQGHDYWGWRFMGWGMHYIGDFSNPYHVMPVPGNSTLKTLWVGLLGMMGLPEAQNEAVQLASNRHTVLEDFQSLIMTQAYRAHNHEHETIQALRAPGLPREFHNGDVVGVMSATAYAKAHEVHDVLALTMPAHMVDDPSVEYSELPVKDELDQIVKAESGAEGYNTLMKTIADLLSGFAQNGASYVASIRAHSEEAAE